MIRNGWSRTATAGSGRSRGTSRSTRPIDEPPSRQQAPIILSVLDPAIDPLERPVGPIRRSESDRPKGNAQLS